MGPLQPSQQIHYILVELHSQAETVARMEN